MVEGISVRFKKENQYIGDQKGNVDRTNTKPTQENKIDISYANTRIIERNRTPKCNCSGANIINSRVLTRESMLIFWYSCEHAGGPFVSKFVFDYFFRQ